VSAVLPDDDPEVDAFARTFQRVVERVERLIPDPGPTRLQQAIETHLGRPSSGLPVVEQRFPTAEHPNLQLALDTISATSTGARLFGLPAEIQHYSGFGLGNWRSSSPTALASTPRRRRTSTLRSASTACCRAWPSGCGSSSMRAGRWSC
jgi:hypothetical protein